LVESNMISELYLYKCDLKFRNKMVLFFSKKAIVEQLVNILKVYPLKFIDKDEFYSSTTNDTEEYKPAMSS
jgi:hypothetical protein